MLHKVFQRVEFLPGQRDRLPFHAYLPGSCINTDTAGFQYMIVLPVASGAANPVFLQRDADPRQ